MQQLSNYKSAGKSLEKTKLRNIETFVAFHFSKAMSYCHDFADFLCPGVDLFGFSWRTSATRPLWPSFFMKNGGCLQRSRVSSIGPSGSIVSVKVPATECSHVAKGKQDLKGKDANNIK